MEVKVQSVKTLRNRRNRNRKRNRKNNNKNISINPKANQTRVGRRKNRKPRNRNTGVAPAGVLSPCSLLYAKVLSNPFGEFSENPCIPDFMTLPSMKIKATCRSTMTVGTNGVGWAVFNPFTMIFNNPGINSEGADYPLISSNGTFTGTSFWSVYPVNSINSMYNAAGGNCWLTSSFLAGSTNRQVRLVGGGVEAVYVGTNLNMGGRIVQYREQGNVAVPVNSTAATLLASNMATWSDNPRYAAVTYQPDNMTLLSYQAISVYQPSVNGYGGPCFPLILYVDNAVAGNTYALEAVAFFEVVGTSLSLTRSASDPIGFGAVQSSAATEIPHSGRPAQGEKSFLERVYQNLSDISTSSIGKFAMGALEKATPALLSLL